jgi:Mg2+/Co2+ transporter CorB
VAEAGALIPKRHKRMLMSVLDLQDVTVDDIMVPRSDVAGIDLEDDWGDILDQITDSQHTRLPVFRGDLDDVLGLVHIRDVVRKMADGDLTRESLVRMVREPYFVPEGTPLHTQLLNFQRVKGRVGFVVDEYGDIQGLVTLDDILEEIVGEFTTDPSDSIPEIHRDEDGSLLVDCSIGVRELNRALHWDLPTHGPKTLNGLILEYLETIPEPGTSLKLHGLPLEITQTGDSAVKTVRYVGKIPRKAPPRGER